MKLIYLSILILFSVNIYAQKEAMVYLKNGSQIKGELRKDNTDNSYMLTMSDGSVLEFSEEQIKHIEHNPNDYYIIGKGSRVLSKGTYCSFDINHMAANFSEDWLEGKRIGLGGSLTIGHQFNPYLGIGAGAGLDWHEQIMMPLFLELNGFLSPRFFSVKKKEKSNYAVPFTYRFQVGHNFQIEEWISDPEEFEKMTGGWMVYPSVGLAFPTKKSNTIRFEVGYKFQRFYRKYEYDWSPDYFKQDIITLKSFSLRMGVMF